MHIHQKNILYKQKYINLYRLLTIYLILNKLARKIPHLQSYSLYQVSSAGHADHYNWRKINLVTRSDCQIVCSRITLRHNGTLISVRPWPFYRIRSLLTRAPVKFVIEEHSDSWLQANSPRPFVCCNSSCFFTCTFTPWLSFSFTQPTSGWTMPLFPYSSLIAITQNGHPSRIASLFYASDLAPRLYSLLPVSPTQRATLNLTAFWSRCDAAS